MCDITPIMYVAIIRQHSYALVYRNFSDDKSLQEVFGHSSYLHLNNVLSENETKSFLSVQYLLQTIRNLYLVS
jgi:hypothetical protein